MFCIKQKTAYEMRISDWSQTCALPIYATAVQPCSFAMVQKGSKIASRVSSSGSSASVVTWASRMRRDSLAIACCPSSYRIDMRRGLSADREFLGLVGHQRGQIGRAHV